MHFDETDSSDKAEVVDDGPNVGVDGTPAAESFPIVGVGASAGGLEAFTQLLSHLPPDTHMAFVLVQHLDPKQASHLAELLGKKSPLPVVEVTDGLKIQPDHVYVIPPNAAMIIEHGALRLTPRSTERGLHLPIDHFFRSLAADRASQAIGIVLSGTGSDGSAGLNEIKGAGGITFAQDEQSAKFAGMPASAVGGGNVDFVLAPEAIAQELARLAKHAYVQPPGAKPEPGPGADLRPVFSLLRKAHSVDFTGYRDSTIRRRIARRMVLRRTESTGEYAHLLEQDRAELNALYRDLLINVTSFFRDPEVFETLKTAVFPELIQNKSLEVPIRIWVPGCSTGEEAHSLAIVLLEFLDQQTMRPPIQIFATDISDAGAIDRARAGLYPETIAADVSPERLRRFFTHDEGRYRISKSIRDMVVFARHNVAADPPFSHMDLISCRNLLIYLSSPLQQRVIPLFHYALDPGGFLLLGNSESVGRFTDLFSAVDSRQRIFRRTAAVPRLGDYPTLAPFGSRVGVTGRSSAEHAPSASDLQKEADRIVLGRYAPAGVLVSADLQVLQFRGHTRHYLEPPPGEASFDLLRMARDNLFLELRSAIDEARGKDVAVRRQGIRLRDGERVREIGLEVLPLRPPGHEQGGFLVLFEEASAGTPETPPPTAPPPPAEGEMAHLRQELADLRSYMDALNEQHAAAVEELKSANEEVLSANEELQSVNEELQTAREELQSNNEELTTVNEELQARNLEISRISDDLSNSLNSVRIPMVILGTDLRVRRFTPAAATVLNLLPTDLGRPLRNIRQRFELPELEQMILDVIGSMTPCEREVRDEDGHWYTLRVLPYRTGDNRIDGAVVVLVDINELRQMQEQLQETRDFNVAIVDTVREPLLVLNAALRVQHGNRSFYEFFHLTPAEIEGRFLHEIGKGAYDIPKLRALLEDILPSESTIEGFELDQDFPHIGRRILQVNARRLIREGNHTRLILVAFEDVTERTERARRLSELKDELTRANAAKDRFLATLSHELRTPLTPVLLSAGALAARTDLPGDVRDDLEVVRRNVALQARLIDDLLDLTRIARGTLELEMQPQDVRELLKAAVQVCEPDIAAKQMHLELDWDDARPYVMGDGSRLQQVFWNLLRNALKFTPPHGHIKLRCRRVEELVIVQVIDDGMGIGRDILPRLFRPFEQATRQTGQSGGLGLGLSVAKAIAEAHGGSIRAASPGKGRGATFTVQLPASVEAEQALTARRPAPPTPAAPPAVAACSILVVEDHPETVRLLARLLARCGHDVASAMSVAAAKRVAAERSFDLLICDLGLPDGSGHELMHYLKRRYGLKGIALTGYGMEEDRVRSEEAGFVEHLVKPVDFDALQAAIARVCVPTSGSQAKR